jgi:hypothetical protein
VCAGSRSFNGLSHLIGSCFPRRLQALGRPAWARTTASLALTRSHTRNLCLQRLRGQTLRFGEKLQCFFCDRVASIVCWFRV